MNLEDKLRCMSLLAAVDMNEALKEVDEDNGDIQVSDIRRRRIDQRGSSSGQNLRDGLFHVVRRDNARNAGPGSGVFMVRASNDGQVTGLGAFLRCDGHGLASSSTR
jgi:hypothetical protein